MKCDGKVLRISLLLTRDIEVIRPQRRPWDSYSWDSRFLSWVDTDVFFQGREYRRNILFAASFETFADSTGGCDWDPSGSVYVSALLLWHGFYYRQKEVWLNSLGFSCNLSYEQILYVLSFSIHGTRTSTNEYLYVQMLQSFIWYDTVFTQDLHTIS